jgi:very-short-patch-repair endonuclease
MRSPIEDDLLNSLVPVLAENGMNLWLCRKHDAQPRRGLSVPDCQVSALSPEPHVPGTPSILVCRQAFEAGYHLDFLLRLANVSRSIKDGFDAVMGVECDGHEWHERTKEQAVSDRARDRVLLIKRGLVTIRFHGSEIYRDANQCARECVDSLLAVGALHGRG